MPNSISEGGDDESDRFRRKDVRRDDRQSRGYDETDVQEAPNRRPDARGLSRSNVHGAHGNSTSQEGQHSSGESYPDYQNTDVPRRQFLPYLDYYNRDYSRPSSRCSYETRSEAVPSPTSVLPQGQKPSDSDCTRLIEGILNYQGQQLQVFLDKLVSKLPHNKPNFHKITLPEFNPESEGADPRSWVSTVSMCLAEHPCSGSDLILILGKSLKGSASRWLSQIAFPTITWDDFQSLFLSQFDITDTIASVLYSQINKTPRENENLVPFATKMLNTLMARLKNASLEQISIGIVLSCLSKFDPRVKRLAFTNEITSRESLVKELKATSFGKRPPTTDTPRIDFKKFKKSHPSDVHNTSSHYHSQPSSSSFHDRKSSEFARKSDTRKPGKPGSFTSYKSSTNTNTMAATSGSRECYSCGSTTHLKAQCPNRNPATKPKPKFLEKRVNLCSTNPPGYLTHKGGHDTTRD
uniref:Plasminogen n=2 Tax=Lygus hesperus TaxID=30085 RepID=A0A0A9XB05_LYGHE